MKNNQNGNMIGFTDFNVILTSYFYEKSRKKSCPEKLLCNALQAELLSSAITVSTYNQKKGHSDTIKRVI